MALNNHVKWYKNNLERRPFCFLCKRREGKQCREMEICKDSLLHLHRIKKTFTSVGPGSGSLMTASSSGTLAAPSLFFLGLSLDVRRVEGFWDFSPPGEPGKDRGGHRPLKVCVFGKASD